MEKPPLGRLEQVELRTYWEREDTDFTPWLASDENIALLGEAIDMDLEVQQQEASVGPFRADILCRNTADNSLVLIENQLERTDHGHLGQLLTYAAGLDAVTLVWIVQRFTDEHRAALDWLNRITEEGFHFFGIEVQVWRIGESAGAPKFNIVAKPNDWSKAVRERVAHGGTSATSSIYLAYWQAFKEHLESTNSKLRPQSPSTSQWMNLPIGRSGLHFTATLSARDKFVTAQLYFERAGAPYYHLLRKQRAEIDAELGDLPIWDHKEDRAACQIYYKRDGDPNDQSTWSELVSWTREKLELFDRVLRHRIAALPRLDPTAIDGEE